MRGCGVHAGKNRIYDDGMSRGFDSRDAAGDLLSREIVIAASRRREPDTAEQVREARWPELAQD